MKKVLTVLIGTIAMLAVLAGPAQADGSTARNKASLARIADGTWTSADLALIKSQPELAAQVPDPSSPPQVSAVSGDVLNPVASQSAVALATTCKWYTVTYTQKSLLGSVIYDWQKYVSLCYNGSAVTSITERYDWLPKSQGMVKVRELTANSASGVGTWTYTSRLQRHLEYCVVQYGCYADTYPNAKVVINGNGTWSYSGAPS